MILLLGGTSDAAPLAERLAQAGFQVLVSTATGVPLNIGKHQRISHRIGRMDQDAMTRLLTTSLRGKEFRALVDATHPYAQRIRQTAAMVAATLGLPYLSYLRPTTVANDDSVVFATNHLDAAKLIFAFEVPVLLTVGSNNVGPYAQESRRKGIPMAVRVLDCDTSIEVCRNAGVAADSIIVGRGPFSIEENVDTIRKYRIGALVTKDSGLAGGVRAKIDAARKEGCHVVVVSRPEQTSLQSCHFCTYGDLVAHLCAITNK